jgi:glycerol-3-phosphate dehydrogenase
MMNRNAFIDELRKRSDAGWDIIVIGGGATGMGIALDAVSRGFTTLLLEQSDFACGTSSRSTKLVHGGVRYMAQGDLLLVMEALHERGLILKNAPHLTSNQEFIIPVYSLKDTFLYTAGLKFYDLLSGRSSIGESYFINRRETLRRLPQLIPNGLRGGVVYHDGQFDDSRMVISLAGACVSRGGLVLNYFKVNGFLKDEKGKINGVKATDIPSGSEFEIKGRVVINAAGVFTDEVIRMDDQHARPSIKPSQGIHIVVDRSFMQGNSALMIPKTDDGRVLFAIPWYDKIVLGTTDTPLDKISSEPKALDSEITFVLNTAGKYLVRPPRREDILSIFAGLRPLAADPGNPASTKEVSRRHKIILTPSGLLSVIGGKWTTYRRMAEDTINKAIKSGRLDERRCVTSDLGLASPDLNKNTGRLRIYGDKAYEIDKMIREKPELGRQLDPRLPYTEAELIWICRNEMPVNLEDLLARRTRALFLDARASAGIAAEAARIMASEMGFDTPWQKTQTESFERLVVNYI